ncbi:MAG: hypothetical protein ACOYXM_02960 [Actinomycetota bacterium]
MPWWRRRVPLWTLILAGVAGVALGAASAAEPAKDNGETAATSATTERQQSTAQTTTTAERTTTTRPTTTTTTKPRYTVGEKIEYVDGSSVQVFTWEQPVPPANEYSTPDPGFEYGVLDVEVCAGGQEEAAYNSLALSARMADNRVYDDAFGTAREPDLSSGDIPAGGGCRRGYVTLSVPAGQQPVAILWDYGGRQAEWAR